MLNFNLKLLFLYCLILGGWNLFLPYTLGCGVILCSGFVVYKRHNLSIPDLIFMGAFLLNLWYVTASEGNVRQHDYYNFVMHADYILKNNFFWDKPINYLSSVFFQPPLWGFFTAFVAKVCMAFGASQANGIDTVRFFSLFCISGCGILFWRLMGEFKFSLNIKIWTFLYFCFLPINGLAANWVNNDSVTYFLMMMIIIKGYQWYLNPEWKKTLCCAGLLAVVGEIKFSGLMVLPVLGIWGLLRLIQAKNKFSTKLWGQFLIIGLGALLGFGWGFFLLYYHFPLVPPPLDNVIQNMEGYTIGDRLFSFEHLKIPFIDITNGVLEPNVWLALLKTSLFGEWAWNGLIWGYLLYILGLISVLYMLSAAFGLFEYKIDEDGSFNLACLVAVFAVLIPWCKFWMDYPFFSSTEFRYIMILQPFALVWMANFADKKSLPKVVKYTLASGIILMIIARFMLYLNTI